MTKSLLTTLLIIAIAGCTTTRPFSMFEKDNQQCYDRDKQPWTFVVDSHIHFRSFNRDALPFDRLTGYLKSSGVMFANIYGIGQTLPKDSQCRHFTRCPGVPVSPSVDNDLINARNMLDFNDPGLHLTLSMSFADLDQPHSILPQINRLDSEFSGQFKWMGEVNLVKQALFNNGHRPVELKNIAKWADFMAVLLERHIPIAIHADLGNNQEHDKYAYLMEQVLERYPGNKIVWVHMGLSREQDNIGATALLAKMADYLERYPNLMLDISWKILWQQHFSRPGALEQYVLFFNRYHARILTGSDVVADRNLCFKGYKSTVKDNSRILARLNNRAFRHIALGQNYFDLLNLDYTAPKICQD